MPMKKWFQNIQPVPLYMILSFSMLFFIVELVVSHLTHSLTLLMNSYHMLCNIIALLGCIVTLKHGKPQTLREEIREESKHSTDKLSTISLSVDEISKSTKCHDKEVTNSKTRTHQETKLKNTFGWARIDIIFLLIGCVFLASLVFSVIVEAAQTLVHIDHQDEMHKPIVVAFLGSIGLLLNAICYVLIGGYTFHQGSFLYVTEEGDVILDRVVTSESVSNGGRRLSRSRTGTTTTQNRERQTPIEMLRDVISCIFVIIASIIVYFTQADVAKFVDPILSIISSIVLLFLSFPYMKESCLILLQTIPNSMNIDNMRGQLLEHFPDILNVHDFHVWQLTTSKVISTVHIIFQNPRVYAKIIDEINEFFTEQGITQLTIQPEFFSKVENQDIQKSDLEVPSCLMKCKSEGCISSHCCPQDFGRALEINAKSKSTTTVDLKCVEVQTAPFKSKSEPHNLDDCDTKKPKVEPQLAPPAAEDNQKTEITEDDEIPSREVPPESTFTEIKLT